MKERVNIRLDEKLVERLKKAAEEEHRTLTNLIETALLKAFPEEEK